MGLGSGGTWCRWEPTAWTIKQLFSAASPQSIQTAGDEHENSIAEACSLISANMYYVHVDRCPHVAHHGGIVALIGSDGRGK